jgi:hypothetical protein
MIDVRPGPFVDRKLYFTREQRKAFGHEALVVWQKGSGWQPSEQLRDGQT